MAASRILQNRLSTNTGCETTLEQRLVLAAGFDGALSPEQGLETSSVSARTSFGRHIGKIAVTEGQTELQAEQSADDLSLDGGVNDTPAALEEDIEIRTFPNGMPVPANPAAYFGGVTREEMKIRQAETPDLSLFEVARELIDEKRDLADELGVEWVQVGMQPARVIYTKWPTLK